MCTRRICQRLTQRGVTLVELVVFIVVVSVGVVGLLTVGGSVVRGSADPMNRKQALAVAQSLLLEITQQPFTYCDPQDAAAISASSTSGCTGGAANSQDKGGAAFPAPGAPSPTPVGEIRGDAANPYDNVADYAGYQASGADVTGVAELVDLTASVTISRVGGSGAWAALPLDAVLQIVVRVTGRGEDVSLTGWRVRYAPNAPG